MGVSCQKLDDDVLASSDEETNLKITAKSAEVSPIAYPVYLYAFSEKGNCAASQKIASESVPMSLQLASGKYHIVAVAGVSKGYVMPDNPSIDDEIVLKDNDGAGTAMMVGNADVTIGGKENSVTLKMINAVTSVRVELKNVPSGVTSVQVALSSLYSSFSFNGKYGRANGKLNVNCNLGTDGVWTSNVYYFFPGSSAQTTLSIVLNKNGSSETYGYTSQDIPKANHPYLLCGSYAGNITVGGAFLPEGWGEPVNVDFAFGTGGDAGGDDDDNEDEDVDTSDIPEIGSIWKGCIVAHVGEPDSKGVDLLLMSLEEWQGGAYSAEELIYGYAAGDITNWRLPTDVEAKLLKSLFSGRTLMLLNDKIAKEGFTRIDDDEEVRYVCLKANLFYSFRFMSGTSVTKAGATKLYNIRAVKTYHLSFTE